MSRLLRISVAVTLLCLTASLTAKETDSIAAVQPDTLALFSGQVVSDEKHIYGRKTLKMDNTVVTDSGILKALANDSILVSDEMSVTLGGTLELNGAGQNAVHYSYNASGFRTARAKGSKQK